MRLFVRWLLLCVLGTALSLSVWAGDPLGEVKTLHLQFQTTPPVKNCQAALVQQLTSRQLDLASKASGADAVLSVSLKGEFRGQHDVSNARLTWAVHIRDHLGKRLYTTHGETSGPSLEQLCQDLAVNLAVDIKDSIRNAGLKKPPETQLMPHDDT